jgi:hypothetical protein
VLGVPWSLWRLLLLLLVVVVAWVSHLTQQQQQQRQCALLRRHMHLLPAKAGSNSKWMWRLRKGCLSSSNRGNSS